MADYKHIFFDLDRTLWDFEKNSAEVLKDFFNHYGLEELGVHSFEDFLATYRDINKYYWKEHREGRVDKYTLRTERFRVTLEEFGVKDSRLSEDLGNDYIDKTPEKTALIMGSVQILEYLADRYYLHIITNGFEETQYRKMEGTNLNGRFDVIVTSDKAGARKPAPEIFEFSLKESGAEPYESLMVGDDPEADIIGAQKVPMDQVLLDPTDEHTHVEPTYRIRELIELKRILS